MMVEVIGVFGACVAARYAIDNFNEETVRLEKEKKVIYDAALKARKEIKNKERIENHFSDYFNGKAGVI